MTSDLAALAQSPPGVLWHEAEAPPADLAARATAAGLALHRVDLSGAHGKKALLAALGRALRFPVHYGQNWDALADCLGDLSWLEPGPLLVSLEQAGPLAARAPGDLATALDVLREAAAAWRERGRPVLFLWQGPARPAGVPALR